MCEWLPNNHIVATLHTLQYTSIQLYVAINFYEVIGSLIFLCFHT